MVSACDRLISELTSELRTRESAGLRRRTVILEAIDGARIRIDGREVVNWCSNDYLGLSSHPRLASAAALAASTWGVGARASRLLTGTTTWHVRLEAALADWFGTEAALVFSSGYLANVGVLRTVLSAGDTVYVDRLAHASLVDAARSSRATLRVFPHNDVEALGRSLSRTRGPGRRVVVTEGVFSMDGDRAPLEALVGLADARGALVYLDDAHGAFVIGETGRGAPEAAGVTHERLLYVGTLGKALGCQGGFVAGPKVLIESLQNRARTFVYSTALAVPVAAAAAEALDVLREEPHLVAALRGRCQLLRDALESAGWPAGPERRGHRPARATRAIRQEPPSHIVPLVVGSPSAASELAQRLWEAGCWAPPIRPPTVPQGTSRLRLSVTVHHTGADMARLVGALGRAGSARHTTDGDGEG